MPIAQRDPHLDLLAHIGWNEPLSRSLAALQPPQARAVRVCEQHRSEYRVHDGERLLKAKPHPALLNRLDESADGIAVGDWALIEDNSGGHWITQLLPRTSLLARGREDGSRQRIAANVDTALLVMGLDGDFSPQRLERYLLLVRGAKLTPVVVLTKPDRCADVDANLREIRAIAGPDADIHVLDPRTPQALEALAPYLATGQTLVLLGSSGVGKSTLMNTLLGDDGQRTGATREYDDRGRHTTTSRALRPLPQGACLIDTPGVRELRLSGEEAVEQDAFEDIQQLAANCRFSDCQHRREPGCAVTAGVEAERLARYHKLKSELAATNQLRSGRSVLPTPRKR